MTPAIKILHLHKTYQGGFEALQDINLEVRAGEIFALLGPNGAGKTTLISIICGIVNATSGDVWVNGYHMVRDYRATRSLIGLVPQELTITSFETVWNTVSFSRGLFGKPKDPAFIEQTLKKLSLWDKRDHKIMTLSGGMKRRLMIAKALSHEPRVLFLDEPTAGVDVELRSDMWDQIRALRETGVTVILTTHYIEEAELMADRIGIINKSRILLVEETAALIKKFGTKVLTLDFCEPLRELPESLSSASLHLSSDQKSLNYTYNAGGEDNGVDRLLQTLSAAGIHYQDVHTANSSLEDIFVRLIRNERLSAKEHHEP